MDGLSDFIVIPKNIVDDWKFNEGQILKFWVLLLIEDLESEKDKDGLFEIRNLCGVAKRAGINRQKAHRLLKKMEQKGDLEWLPSYWKGGEPKSWNQSEEKSTKIRINKPAPNGHDAGQSSGHKTGHSLIDTKAWNEGDNINLAPEKSVIQAGIKPVIKKGGFENNYENDCDGNYEDTETGRASVFDPTPSYMEELVRRSKQRVIEMEDEKYRTERPSPRTPPTLEEENITLRRAFLRRAIEAELQHTLHHTAFLKTFKLLINKYNGENNKDAQLSIRREVYDKMIEQFGETLDITRQELLMKNGPLHNVVHRDTEGRMDQFLTPEFMTISREARVQISEQSATTNGVIKFRGARHVGDIARDLIGHFAGHSATPPQAPVEAAEPTTTFTKPGIQAGTRNFNEAFSEAVYADKDGIPVAFNNINIKNKTKIKEKNIRKTPTEEKENNQKMNMFSSLERGVGETSLLLPQSKSKNSDLTHFDTQKQVDSARTTLKKVTSKLKNKVSHVTEIHPDGNPSFSTTAFKSLPRDKQLEIIESRLGQLAEKFPTIEVNYEFEHWKDWMLAKGTSFKDYSAAFRNWLRNVLVFASTNSPKGPRVYNTSATRLTTKEIFTNPAHVMFSDKPDRNNRSTGPGRG